MKKLFILLFLAGGVCVTPAAAQWRLEGWFGDAYNAKTSMTIHQDGEDDLHLNANWSTRPWRPTWYYSARIAKWSGERAWAFEYMHHKLYLDNPTDEVLRFRITNGVNNFLAERLWRTKGWEYGVGLGPVLAVPISTVRGKSYGYSNGVFNSVYELAGGTLQGSMARRLKLIPYVYGELAVKGTITRLYLNIADGHTKFTNYALHLQYGISFQNKK